MPCGDNKITHSSVKQMALMYLKKILDLIWIFKFEEYSLSLSKFENL